MLVFLQKDSEMFACFGSEGAIVFHVFRSWA